MGVEMSNDHANVVTKGRNFIHFYYRVDYLPAFDISHYRFRSFWKRLKERRTDVLPWPSPFLFLTKIRQVSMVAIS